MVNKYEVLNNSDRFSVIELNVNESGKQFWSVYIPDAGDRNSANRITRLLNAEHQLYLDRVANRNGQQSETK